jgi:hypothetical protein
MPPVSRPLVTSNS